VYKDSIDLFVVVSDADAALRFYRDALGLSHFANTELADGGVLYRLRAGSSVLKVVEYKDGRAGNPFLSPATECGFRFASIFVQDIDERVARLSSAGFTVAVDPVDTRPGFRIAMIDDPDGNRLELIQSDEP
jgi:glyoxylase I family protein